MSQEDETTEFFGIVQSQQDRIAELEQAVRDAENLLLLNPLNILPESMSSTTKKWYRQVKAWQDRVRPLLIASPQVVIAEKKEEEERTT
jgi:hypothetical protein